MTLSKACLLFYVSTLEDFQEMPQLPAGPGLNFEVPQNLYTFRITKEQSQIPLEAGICWEVFSVRAACS